jgi:hypothetical protein
MSLKPCRECGKQTSIEARVCPHCGAVDPTRELQRAGQRVVVGCLVGVLATSLLVLGMCWFWRPPFRVVAEKTLDMALKTQVEQHLVITEPMKPEMLRSLLEKQYGSIMARGGYRYHEAPTNVYLYIYDRPEDATALAGTRPGSRYQRWIAMLRKDYDDSEPQILFRHSGHGARPDTLLLN